MKGFEDASSLCVVTNVKGSSLSRKQIVSDGKLDLQKGVKSIGNGK